MSEPHLISSGPLLNFHKRSMKVIHPVTGATVTALTVEHYFQACKGLFLKKGAHEDFVSAVDSVLDRLTARDAKNAGRQLDINVQLWDHAAFTFMIQGHIAKFSQHEDLREMLLETWPKKLVEHRPDPIWGDNMDGSGKNLCGKSLMIARRISRGYGTGRH